MANRRFGWHSGSVNCRDLTVANDLTISGDLSFGDASTDTLTVNGAFVANGDSTLGSGNGDTIAFGSGTDSVSVGVALGVTGNINSTGNIVSQGNITGVNGVLSGTLGVTGALSATGNITSQGNLECVNDCNVTGNIGLQGSLSATGSIEASSYVHDGADASFTFSGLNTGAVPALVFPDDTYIADADGTLGSTQGFILVQVGSTEYKLQTYATA